MFWYAAGDSSISRLFYAWIDEKYLALVGRFPKKTLNRGPVPAPMPFRSTPLVPFLVPFGAGRRTERPVRGTLSKHFHRRGRGNDRRLNTHSAQPEIFSEGAKMRCYAACPSNNFTDILAQYSTLLDKYCSAGTNKETMKRKWDMSRSSNEVETIAVSSI